jgi:hypothetical protein
MQTLSKVCNCLYLAGKDLIVHKVEDKLYCSDARSTAYEFPLMDAPLSQGENGPELEVPLDGTRYSLETGVRAPFC